MGTPHSASVQPSEALLERPPASMQGVINTVIDTVHPMLTPNEPTSEVLECTQAAGDGRAVTRIEDVPSTGTSLAPEIVAAKEKMISVIKAADLNSNMRNSDRLTQVLTEHDAVRPDEPEHTVKPDEPEQVYIMSVTPIANVANVRGGKSISTCLYCPYGCYVDSQMILHMLEHYDFTARRPLSQSSNFCYEAGKYLCVSCALETPSRLMFREHVRCHVHPKPYMCVDCGAFLALKDVRGHYTSMHKGAIPDIHVAPSDIVDTLMQRLGSEAPLSVTNILVPATDAPLAVCKPVHVPNRPHTPDSVSAHSLQSISKSCLTKITQGGIESPQRSCEKEASHVRDTEFPLAPYNIDVSADSAEYMRAAEKPRRGSEDAESGVHDMDLELGDGENAPPQDNVSPSSDDMPASQSYEEVKLLQNCQPDQETHIQAPGKPDETSEKVSTIEKRTVTNQPEQPKPTQIVVLKRAQQPPVKKPSVKKQTLKLLVDFDNGVFTCKSCNLKERDEAVFRKHIWHDIHLSGVCSHGGSASSVDGCSILNDLMHMLHPKTSVSGKQTHTSAAPKPTDVVTEAATETRRKQKAANRARVKRNLSRLAKNLARIERKDTRAAARAARSKLGRTTKTTKSESDDEDDDDDDDEFSPDDSNDEDWCNETSESSLSEEEDAKSDCTPSIDLDTEESVESSDSNYSKPEDLSPENLEQPVTSATYKPHFDNECQPTRKTTSVNSEHMGETGNSITPVSDRLSEPATSEPSDDDDNDAVTPKLESCGENSGMDTLELQGSSHPATPESNPETDTPAPDDQMNVGDTPEVRESPEYYTPEQSDTTKDGITKPQYEGSSNSSDKEKSQATQELQGTLECNASEKNATEKNGCEQREKKTSDSTKSSKTDVQFESSSSSDDVIVLSEEFDKSAKPSSKSTPALSGELDAGWTTTGRRTRHPRKSTLNEEAMMNSEPIQITITPKRTKTAQSGDDKKATGKTTEKPTKGAEKKASTQKKKENSENDKPGVDGGDNETDSEDEEESGHFYKCRLPACGRSYEDVASLKAHIKKSHSTMTLFPCPYCSCLWSDYNRMLDHFPAHSGPTPYRCVQCDVCFAKNSQLRKHLKKSHHVNKKFKCTLPGCTFDTNLWTDFKVHNLSYHTNEKAFKCFACDADFANLNDYFLHIESGMETLICCSQCTMKAKMRHTILRHAGSVHPGLSKGVFVETTVKCAEPNSPPQPTAVLVKTKRVVYQHTKKIILHECSNCDFADENKASFDRHVKSHTLSDKLQLAFSCPHCPFGSSDINQYKTHIANHRSTPTHQLRCFKCTHCPFVTNVMMMIEKHLQEMHKNRPFKFEVQQDVVTAKMKRTDANLGVTRSEPSVTILSTVVQAKSGSSATGKVQQSVNSTETSSSGNAVKKDVVDKHRMSTTETKRIRGKRRRRIRRIISSEDDDDEDEDDDDTYSPVEKSKHLTTPEPTTQATDRSLSLRRSCRIAKAPKTTDTINNISSDETEAGDYEEPTVPLSKRGNDSTRPQPTTPRTAPAERTPVTAPRAVAKDGGVQIDRFHCDSCEFACADWNVMHDHVQSSHGNWTQWNNVNMAVTSTATTTMAAAADEPASSPGDKTTTATDVDSGVALDAQRYSCNLCSTSCREWDAFKTHMADAHSYDVIKPDDANSNIMAVPIERPRVPAPVPVYRGGQYRCPNCTFSTDSKTSMWRHKKGHSTRLKAGYKCVYCNYTSPQKFVITRHFQNCHPDKPTNQTHVVVLQSRKMPAVSQKAADRRPPTEHTVVGVDSQSSGNHDVVQPEPEQSGAPLEDRESHSDNDDLPDDEDDNGVGQTNADCSSYCSRVASHDLFQCNLCEFMHRFPSKVLRHFNYRHTKHCPYQCGYCDFRSVESGKVKRHCGSAHRGQAPMVIKVDVDAKTSEPVGVLMTRSNKDGDVETEGSDEDDDKQDGDNQWWWRRHVMTSNNQVVSCKLCGYRQVGTSALKRHILAVHLGFTPFACKYCDFSTMEIRKVREHIRKTHPGLECKVVRRKYQDVEETPPHSGKGGRNSGEAGEPQSPLPTIRVRSRTSVSAREGRADDNTSFVDTPVSQTADVFPDVNATSATAPTLLASTLLNVKPEPSVEPDTARRPTKHMKFYRCIYCDFCSEESLHDIRDHIFVAHLHRNHFVCPYCQYGSMTREDVIAHCLTVHPDDTQKVDEDRTHTRNISILETHGDVLLVGMMTDNKVPLIELPKNLQEIAEIAPPRTITSVTEAPPAGQRTAAATGPTSRRSRPTARKRTSAVFRNANEKATEKANATKKKQNNEKVVFACRACGFTSHRRDTVQVHVLAIHLQKKAYQCSCCKKNYDKLSTAQGHVTTFHPGKKAVVLYIMKRNRNTIRSFVVNKVIDGAGVTAKAGGRKTRRKTAASKEPTEIQPETRACAAATVGAEPTLEDGAVAKLQSPSTTEDASVSSTFMWKCTTCGTKLAMLEAMRHHVLTAHMDTQPYQCAVCVFGGRTSELVEAHIRDTHRHSRIHIPVVDVVAEKGDALKERMVRVRTKKAPATTAVDTSKKFDYSTLCTVDRLGEPVYRCDMCDHVLKSKASIIAHRQSHSKFRRYGCSYCAYGCSQTIFMGSHIINVHPGRPMKYHDYRNSGAGSNDQSPKGQVAAPNKSGQSVLGKASRRSGEVEKNARVTDYFPAAVKSPDDVKTSASLGEVTPSSEDNADTGDAQQSFECLMCGKTMQLGRSVRYHIMNDHLKYTPYKCNYCKVRHVNRRGVRDHIARCHPDKPCVINYKSNKNLDAIVEANVKPVTGGNADETSKPAQSNAGAKKPSPGDSRAHASPARSTSSSRAHASSRGSTSGASTSPESEDLPAESYVCVLCKTYTATWKHGMLRHIAEEIHYSPFICPHCPFSANRQDTVRNHVKSTHPGLEVSVKFNKDEAKEARALELLEKSVVVRDTNVIGTKIERNRDDSSGSSRGYKRKLSTEELGTVSPVRKRPRRPGPRTPGRPTYWLEPGFQPFVDLVDVMGMPSWELKRLLQRLRLTNVSILF